MADVDRGRAVYTSWCQFLKPDGFEDYLTMGEMASKVGVDRTRIKALERKGRLPSPVRVGVNKNRLYSPAEQAVIVEHFARTAGARKKTRSRRSR